MQRASEQRREDSGEDTRRRAGEGERDTLMMELSGMVQKMVRESSWWERRGVDCSILAAAFLCLPPGKKLTAARCSDTFLINVVPLNDLSFEGPPTFTSCATRGKMLHTTNHLLIVKLFLSPGALDIVTFLYLR